MVRKLKYHEQKLLRKVDFITYKQENSRRSEVVRRYMIQKPEDYDKYNRLCGVSRTDYHCFQLARCRILSPVLSLET